MLSLFSFLTGGWRLVNFISIDGAQVTIYHYNHEIAQSELVYWFFSKKYLIFIAKNYGHFNYGIHIEAFHINYTKFYQTFMKI